MKKLKKPNNRLNNSASITLIILFYFMVSLQTFAQMNYLFEDISIPEGLSNSEVHSMFQDSHGFLLV